MKTLNNEEIDQILKKHPAWKLREGKLDREWTFNNFIAAMAFVNRIAELAEAAQHHPDIDIRYNRVRLSLESHDAGGLTARDSAMVRKLDELTAAD